MFKLQLANVMELKVSVMRRLLVAGSAETVGVSEVAWSKKQVRVQPCREDSLEVTWGCGLDVAEAGLLGSVLAAAGQCWVCERAGQPKPSHGRKLGQ